MGNDGISGLFSYVKRDSLYEYDLTNLTLKRNKVNGFNETVMVKVMLVIIRLCTEKPFVYP